MLAGRLRRALFLSGLAAAPLAACTSSSNVFTCASDSDCTGEGTGQCQSNGFCAFPNAMCESGLRYGEFAGGGFAMMCVPVEGPGSTGVGGSGGISSGPATTDPTVGETTSGAATTSGEASTTSSDTSTSSDGSSSSSSTGAPPPTCQVIFEEDFATDELPPQWLVAGPGLVEVSAGLLTLHPSSEVGDLPTLVYYEPEVGFESAWLMVDVDGLTSAPGLAGAISLVRDDESALFELIYASDSTVLARSRDFLAGTTMQSEPVFVDGDDPPWLRIRESQGRVLFEYGPTPDSLVVFHEFETDIRDWTGGFIIAADNFEEPVEGGQFDVESASACVVSP